MWRRCCLKLSQKGPKKVKIRYRYRKAPLSSGKCDTSTPPRKKMTGVRGTAIWKKRRRKNPIPETRPVVVKVRSEPQSKKDAKVRGMRKLGRGRLVESRGPNALGLEQKKRGRTVEQKKEKGS